MHRDAHDEPDHDIHDAASAVGPGELLLVGDEASARLIAESLEAEGHRCTSAVDSDAARRHIVERRFDVIILDLDLLAGRAFDLVQLAARMTPATLCVVRSRTANVESVIAAMRAGIGDYFVGTLSVPQLRRRIGAAIRRARDSRGRLERVARLASLCRSLVAKRGGGVSDLEELASIMDDLGDASALGDVGDENRIGGLDEVGGADAGPGGPRRSAPGLPLDRVEPSSAGGARARDAGTADSRHARGRDPRAADSHQALGHDERATDAPNGRGRNDRAKTAGGSRAHRDRTHEPGDARSRVSAFEEAASQHLDPEQLVTAAIDHFARELGAVNIAVYLGTGSCRFGLAAYARADLPRLVVEPALIRWADEACPIAAADGRVQILADASLLFTNAGPMDGASPPGKGGKSTSTSDASTASNGALASELSHRAALIVPCRHEAVCDAVFIVMPQVGATVRPDAARDLTAFGESFARQLQRIQRIHSRYRPSWPPEAD